MAANQLCSQNLGCHNGVKTRSFPGFVPFLCLKRTQNQIIPHWIIPILLPTGLGSILFQILLKYPVDQDYRDCRLFAE